MEKFYSKKSVSVVQSRDLAWMQSYGKYINPVKSKSVSKFKGAFLLNIVKLKSSLKTWIPFCDETTIHGLRFAFGATPRYRITRTVWAVLFLSMCSLGLYFCWKTTTRFFEYNVKTITFFDNNREIVFPAITFTNENLFLKSVVQSSKPFLEGVTTFVADSLEDYKKVLPRIFTICYNPGVKTNLTEDLDAGYEFWSKYGMAEGMQMTTPDSFYSVKKCWWMDELVNCTNLFLNHPTDFGWSFTFNPGRSIVTDTIGKEPYGLDVKTYRMKFVRYVGYKNGLQLLLNIGQDDYCVMRQDFSAGFRIMVHNSNIQPLYFMNHPFSASPGYYTNVAIRVTNIKRYTAHLGKCTDFQSLPLYPNATAYYKEACYLDCFTQFTYDNCRCYPFYGPPSSDKVLRTSRNIHENYSVDACYGLNLLCMKSFWRQFISSYSRKNCSLCVDPCNDTFYSLEISNQYFPSYNSIPVLHQVYGINSSLEEWRRNYLMINFYVQASHMLSIEESQDFTLFDWYADIGGILGLFLGMSILSFGEVFHQLAVFLISFCRRYPH